MSFFFSPTTPKAQKSFSVAIITAEFNESFTKKLEESTKKELKKCGIAEQAIELFSVPGAFEIPFAAKKLMNTGDFDSIIALGIIIRGETYHFDVVANESARGLMELNLKGDIPIICGILCTDTTEQTIARIEKGVDFARSAVQMMNFSTELLSSETEIENSTY